MSDKVQPETSAECSLRDRYAEGIGLHLQTDGVPPGECACGWKLSPDDPRQTWYALASHLADAVLAVRDDVLAEKDAEIERLRECRAKHPTNPTVVPCVLDRDHEGDHASTTGCPGSVMHWPTAEAEVARLREAVATVRKTLETVQNERNRAFLLLRVARRICTMPGPLLRAINGTTASESEGDIADDAAEVDAWLRDHALAPRESATEAPRTRDGEQGGER